ncbi:MAG: hypothetical protein ACXVZT_01975 [Terriglobales bacterium]
MPVAKSSHLNMRSDIMAKNREHDELGPDSAGQSGDTQQISNLPDADSESVEELVEEGNALEAGIVEGVEDAKDADVSEVTTRQVPEDDVPAEYLDDENKNVA